MKTNFEVQRNFNADTTLLAFFEIGFRSLCFNFEKRRQYSEVTAIPWDLLQHIWSKDTLLGCIAIGISWWLTNNRIVSRASNDKFES